MTLPSSGSISFGDLITETGQPGGYSSSMSWVNANGKLSVGGATGMTYFAQMYDKAYYQNNNYGNCDDGNCTNNCNCGNINCNNCIINGAVNCANCDGQAYLQPNCNCNCTYNCTTEQTSYNCNCDCWICACTW
jgi:hypothetical protein